MKRKVSQHGQREATTTTEEEGKGSCGHAEEGEKKTRTFTFFARRKRKRLLRGARSPMKKEKPSRFGGREMMWFVR